MGIEQGYENEGFISQDANLVQGEFDFINPNRFERLIQQEGSGVLFGLAGLYDSNPQFRWSFDTLVTAKANHPAHHKAQINNLASQIDLSELDLIQYDIGDYMLYAILAYLRGEAIVFPEAVQADANVESFCSDEVDTEYRKFDSTYISELLEKLSRSGTSEYNLTNRLLSYAKRNGTYLPGVGTASANKKNGVEEKSILGTDDYILIPPRPFEAEINFGVAKPTMFVFMPPLLIDSSNPKEATFIQGATCKENSLKQRLKYSLIQSTLSHLVGDYAKFNSPLDSEIYRISSATKSFPFQLDRSSLLSVRMEYLKKGQLPRNLLDDPYQDPNNRIHRENARSIKYHESAKKFLEMVSVLLEEEVFYIALMNKLDTQKNASKKRY